MLEQDGLYARLVRSQALVERAVRAVNGRVTLCHCSVLIRVIAECSVRPPGDGDGRRTTTDLPPLGRVGAGAF